MLYRMWIKQGSKWKFMPFFKPGDKRYELLEICRDDKYLDVYVRPLSENSNIVPYIAHCPMCKLPHKTRREMAECLLQSDIVGSPTPELIDEMEKYLILQKGE